MQMHGTLQSWIFIWLTITSISEMLHGSSAFSVIPNDESLLHHRERRSIAETSLIPSNYSVYERPMSTSGGPSNVKLSIIIMNVRDIKEIGEEISIEMNIRIYWNDPRLSSIVAHLANSSSTDTEFVLLQPSLLNHIWHPDLFIDHVKKIDQPSIISSPASLRMYPDNTLRYSSRITIIISCPMDFHYYPADTQRCDCDFKSYAYSDKKMVLSWSEKGGAAFGYKLEIANYFIGLDNANTFLVETKSASYSGLRFTIILTRKLSYHMIQTYLPSIVLVVVSWLSFLVSLDSVPGRVTVLMTCLLTLISMFASVRQSTPNVSYVKSVDIWMVSCVFFVFLALMEFTVVLRIKSMKFGRKKGSQADQAVAASQASAVRGARGGIAQVYYPNPLPTRRISNPRVGLGQPIDEEETEMGDYISSRMSSSGDYGDYPMGNRAPHGPPQPGDHSAIYSTRPTTSISNPIPQHYQNVPQLVPAPLESPPPPPSRNDKIIAKFEIVSSIVVPLLFILFNFLYWPWILVSSEYYARDIVPSLF